MFYYLRVVEGCSPKTKKFKNKKGLTKYIKAFIKRHGSIDDNGDNWLDDIYYGKRIEIEVKFMVKK